LIMPEPRSAVRGRRLDEDVVEAAAVATPGTVSLASPTEAGDGSPLRVAQQESPMPGITTWINPHNGFRIVDLEYKADPAKRTEAWESAARAGMPTAEWEREYGKKWVVYEGKPVYGDYSEDRHLVVGNIIVPRRIRLVAGYDAGPNDVNLAWALATVDPATLHVTFIDELHVDDGDADTYCQIINARLRMEWAKLGGFVVHVADQSVFTETNIEKKSFASVLRKHGINPIPGEISFVGRRAAVNKALLTYDAFKVHERCTLIRESLGGGYVYPKTMGGIGGQYREMPLKNKFSHIANCVEYVCSRLAVATMQVPFEGRRLPAMNIV